MYSNNGDAMRTQTNISDTPILTAIIITLCGCTIIAAAFGAPGSLLAGIVFGLLTGFGVGVWAVGKRQRSWAEPQAPGVPPSAKRSDRTPTQSNQQIRPRVGQENVSGAGPISNEW